VLPQEVERVHRPERFLFAAPRNGVEVRRGPGVSLLVLIYVGVGVAIAASHDYFDNVNGWRGVLSAIFAIFLWPLILLGINLHIRK
jgi:hypothetical protein